MNGDEFDKEASLCRLFARLGREFGPASAEAIVRIFAEEIGKLRLTFPDVCDLERMARDRQIQLDLRRATYSEVSQKHGLSEASVRKIEKKQITYSQLF